MGEENSVLSIVKIFVNGKMYEVPIGLTIVEAMEHVGFRFTRGLGCRQGMCGACATIYRMNDDYKLKSALACQELVKEGMHVLMVPYSPAKKAMYDFKKIKPSKTVLMEHYPEIVRCLSCNTCTKACPQDLEVMQLVQAAVRGDIEEVSKLSFECIECGLCAVRCPAEIVPYYVSRLARRLYGRDILGLDHRVEKRMKEIEEGMFKEELEKLSKMDLMKLKKMYEERDFI